MGTGDKRVNLYSKQLFGLSDIRTEFFDYLIELIRDAQRTAYNSQGVFSPVTLAGTVNDTVDISILFGQDAFGHLLEQGALAYLFENTNLTDYFIGFAFGEIPDEVESNPRTGEIEYQRLEEAIGEVGDPDSVADLGGSSLKIIIDTLADAGHSYAGRSARVWLKDPLTLTTWFEDLTITWDGSNNIITTATYLGQTTPSTTAADYEVIIFGPKITVVDISASPGGRCFIGKVTGSGSPSIPFTFDTTNQVVLSTDFQLALNLTTIYKDVYKTPTFPNDGNPKFTDPIEFWWEQEHNVTDYSHDDVTFKTLVNKPQTGVQLEIQALDVPDNSNVKAQFKDNTGTVVAKIFGLGKVEVMAFDSLGLVRALQNTELGTTAADDLTINASIIADVLMDNGGTTSPDLKFASSDDVILDIIRREAGGLGLLLGRDDTVGAAHTFSFWNRDSGGVVNVDVQGFVRTINELILENPTADPSPSLTFKQNGFDDIKITADNDILKVEMNSTVDRIIEILNGGTGDVTLKTEKFIITGTPSLLEGLGILQFKDSLATTAIPFSEAVTGTALDVLFTATSVIGALNELKLTPLAHTSLSDMPSSVNTDHDGRYETKSDLGDQVSNTKGSNLIGHSNTDGGWEKTLVKGILDNVTDLFSVQPKVPIGIYFGASHVVVPAQVVNCKGKIRKSVIETQLTWSDLDSGVVQSANKAYYVYLSPDTSPATTFTPFISDVTPVRGFHTGGGKEDWIYVGSFVTDGSNNVREFTKAGSTVKINSNGETDRQIASHVAGIIDSTKSLADGTVGVVPETAKFAIIEMELNVNSLFATPGNALAYCAPVSPAVNNLHLFLQAQSVGSALPNLGGSNGTEGPVGLDSGRQFIFTLTFVSGQAVSVFLRSRGWVEDNQFGKFL
jgi:hypothetical protein